MSNDPLEKLLQRTDVAYGRPVASHDDLASGAWSVWKRNRMRRQAVNGLTALVVCGIAVTLLLHLRAKPPAMVIESTVGVPQIHVADRRVLEAEDVREQCLIQMMLTAERQNVMARQLAHLPQGNWQQQWDEQREQSATVILQGVVSAPRHSEIAAIYHEVAENFPGTGAAAVARQQLDQLH